MALRDSVVGYLRTVFGRDRDERDKALSPSIEAAKHLPNSIFSVWGREDIGGLLSVSQNLMDRYADYEAMDDYPDINCFAAGSVLYVCDGSVVKPMLIEQLAVADDTYEILAYDLTKERIVRVAGEHPRLTGRGQPVVAIKLSNGTTLRVTEEHRLLHIDKGYVEAKNIKTGDELIGMPSGFNLNGMSLMTYNRAGIVTVISGPIPDGRADVYDVTTKTENLVVNGAVCHNSAYEYFANDATQPDVDTGRSIWVHSKDDLIKSSAETLIHRRLGLEDEIWSMAYTLCKYGNDFEELLITENGVVGLNFLPAPTVRRIEDEIGGLIGFVQDVTGKFTEDAKNLRAYLAGHGQIPDNVAVFDDWQVCHMRLRSTHRRSPYGHSIADGARWIWKRLTLLEDAIFIYRITRAPSRFAFSIDVGDNPSDKVDAILQKAKQNLKKRSLVNPRTNKMDMRYNPLCITGDTKIPLLDGTEKTVLEMIKDFESGKQNWTYSIDRNNGNKIVPGKVVWAGKTRENAQLVKVTLDNGESIRVTPDHKMMHRDGSYVEAKDLKSSDSLMPLYRKVSSKAAGDTLDGYEMVYDPADLTYKYTHRIVGKMLGLRQDTSKDSVIHHKNFKKLNNDPSNLEEMERTTYSKLHCDAHKVVSVEFLTEKEDTYCITIDVTHNFATSCGIVIKNSMDEDFFFASRNGQPMAKVDVLSGPNYQSVEDVDYFLRKLHGVLKVPRSYLGQDSAIPGKSLLSNEDVRAARVTLGVQRELRNGIARIIRVDQAARNMNPWRVPFEVRMTVPSGIYELAQMEVRNARTDFAHRFLPFVSMDWVRRFVFKLTDDEIETIDKQTEKEQQRQLEQQLKSQQAGLQMQQNMSPGMPPGMPEPGSPSPLLLPGASDLPRTQLDWKRYTDNQKRLEEQRQKQTNARFNELEDSFETMMSKNKQFAAWVAQRKGLFEDLRHAGFTPSGQKRLNGH